MRYPSPRPDHTAQGSSTRKINPHNSGGWGSGRNCQIFRKLCLKDLHGLKMYANPPTLGLNTRATTGRATVSYMK